MTNYQKVNVNITENQQQKIKQSIAAKCAAVIKFKNTDMEGDHSLFLTRNTRNSKMRKVKTGELLLKWESNN